MTILPLSKLLISIEDTNSGVKNSTGLVREWETLLDKKIIEQLRRKHQGIFCFLAFDHEFDLDILSFVKSGALAAESGDKIMILYAVNDTVDTLTFVDDEDLDKLFKFDNKSNANYTILQSLFGEGSHFTQPGLLVFDNIYNSDKSIYIPLINKFPSKIDCLRKVIEVTRKSIDGKNNVDSILSKVGIALSTSDIEYQKNTKYSFGECVVIICKLLLKTKSDLISIFV